MVIFLNLFFILFINFVFFSGYFMLFYFLLKEKPVEPDTETETTDADDSTTTRINSYGKAYIDILILVLIIFVIQPGSAKLKNNI